MWKVLNRIPEEDDAEQVETQRIMRHNLKTALFAVNNMLCPWMKYPLGRPGKEETLFHYPFGCFAGRRFFVNSAEEALILSRTFCRLAENRVRFVDDYKRRK